MKYIKDQVDTSKQSVQPDMIAELLAKNAPAITTKKPKVEKNKDNPEDLKNDLFEEYIARKARLDVQYKEKKAKLYAWYEERLQKLEEVKE
jgi:hypothetical protein